MIRCLLTLVLLVQAAPAAVAVRILPGVGDTEATNWPDGVAARGASIAALEPWRFDGDDAMQPEPFAKVHIIKDSKYEYSTSPGKAAVDLTWRDSSPTSGKTSYYYVRGEQQDNEIVWVSPMWVTYTGGAQ